MRLGVRALRIKAKSSRCAETQEMTMIQLNNLREMRAHLPENICASTEAIMRETLTFSAAKDTDDIELADVFG